MWGLAALFLWPGVALADVGSWAGSYTSAEGDTMLSVTRTGKRTGTAAVTIGNYCSYECKVKESGGKLILTFVSQDGRCAPLRRGKKVATLKVLDREICETCPEGRGDNIRITKIRLIAHRGEISDTVVERN
jgi:hypothetical protein